MFRHHHEALEHLLHLTYYAMGLQPPKLVKRVYSSKAAGIGAAKWRQAFRAADELPSNLQVLASGDAGIPLLREGSEAERLASEFEGQRSASSVVTSAESVIGPRAIQYNKASGLDCRVTKHDALLAHCASSEGLSLHATVAQCLAGCCYISSLASKTDLYSQ